MREPRFATHAGRARHIYEIYRFVADELKSRTSDACERLLTAADIPWTRMNSLTSLIEDPHLAQTGFFRHLEHPAEGPVTSMAVPARYSASVPELRRHAPRFGEHSEELLREAGYSEAEIAALIADGVTRTAAAPA
jgi:crotonobetainyl-CoA:carnitine CoA-transferase CaiB-like acyl-CoA transferase